MAALHNELQWYRSGEKTSAASIFGHKTDSNSIHTFSGSIRRARKPTTNESSASTLHTQNMLLELGS
ncbi:hypothetical protein VTI28DRAFT_8105 [Corynascus sepedonium]